MFEFNVENTGSSQASNDNRPKVDWDARAKYIVDKVGTQAKPKAMIGVVSGIIDLGLQAQEDARMEFNGGEEAEREELAKNPQQYFETLPNDKGVPTRYKRWAVKPCQHVALTIDFPSIKLNQSQFFGDDDGQEHPLRMILNGEFYMKDVGKVVGKPYNVKEVKQADGSWAFKNNTQIHKLAAATDVLNENGFFKPKDLGKLLGKAALFEVQVFLKKGADGKEYLNEKIKLSGQVPEVMIPMIPELPSEYIYGVNFKGAQDQKVIKQLRQSVINTMKLAQNFDGSEIQKALGESAAPQPKQEEKKSEQKQVPNDSYEDPLDDLPFNRISNSLLLII